MKVEEELSAKMLLCSHCPKEFRYNSERKRHELSHFPRFECETCSKKFSFVSALRRHEKQHERTGSVKCDECHRKFRDDVLLKRHIKYAHKGTYICEKCNSKFSSDLALRTHMKSHRPESERRFKCSHEGCTKSFNFSHHLKHHELTHTNAKQYYCCFCGKGFIQSHHLKTHLKAHDPTGWLYCESPGCKKKFSTDYARKRHMFTHKNKPDSGISSDSNSCDASITSKNNEESILCTTCGEALPPNEYKAHSEKCIKEESSTINMDELDKIVEEWPNSPFKPSASKEDTTAEFIIEKDIDNCDMLAGCIVNNESYLSTQIETPINENFHLTLIESNNVEKCGNEANINIEVSKHNGAIADDPVIVKISSLCDYNQNNEMDMCEGCDCANICNDKISMYLTLDESPADKPGFNKVSDVPCIEYRIDGVIKIRDTFDDDIVLKTEKDDLKGFIQFSNCKDVIGNCLVSGGDGCLCARMMAEDQAIMAQEIDDITPHPKTEPL